MIAYREVLNDKEDIKKIIEILNNLKQKAEVIILPLTEPQSKKIDETDSIFDNFQIDMSDENKEKKMSSISIDTVGYKFDRDEAHER